MCITSPSRLEVNGAIPVPPTVRRWHDIFGGGIVQDLSAFVANVLYRGISWVLVPTTLLAQADSCIGSKSSLNYAHYKNLLGYIYPPVRILVNTGFLHTLEPKEYKSGFGEMLKCAIMDGRKSFEATASHLKEIFVSDGGQRKS